MSRRRPTKFLRLRYAMADKGVTQKDLCNAYNEKYHVAERTIDQKWALYQVEMSRYLCGQRPFRMDVMWFIMNYLGLPKEMLYLYFPEGGIDRDD